MNEYLQSIINRDPAINVAGAIKLAQELGNNKTIVTILCYKSDRYQGKLFNKKFLMDKNLPYPKWL